MALIRTEELLICCYQCLSVVRFFGPRRPLWNRRDLRLVVLKFAIGSMKAARFATESVATGCSAPSEGSVFSLVSGWQPARLRGVSRVLSLDRAFQNHHAGGHFRFQVVFAAHKDVESLIRRGSFEAALQVFIHAQNAQQFRGFAASLNPDKVCLLGRCQLLR